MGLLVVKNLNYSCLQVESDKAHYTQRFGECGCFTRCLVCVFGDGGTCVLLLLVAVCACTAVCGSALCRALRNGAVKPKSCLGPRERD